MLVAIDHCFHSPRSRKCFRHSPSLLSKFNRLASASPRRIWTAKPVSCIAIPACVSLENSQRCEDLAAISLRSFPRKDPMARENAPPLPLPVIYLSHGSPMSAIEFNEEAAFWAKLGSQIITLPGVKTILIVSGHWEEHPVRVNTGLEPPTIYDFYGFPAPLYQIQYPGKGSPETAQKVIKVLAANGITARGDAGHGLDHGSWVPLKWMLPGGTIPVVQLSLIRGGSMRDHVALGRALKPLREEGILIVGSGTAVHNIPDMRVYIRSGKVAPYVDIFDKALEEAVVGDLSAAKREQKLIDLAQHPSLRKAHPSLEHLLPLHVAGGAAGDDVGQKVHHRQEMSFSNACFTFGNGFAL